MKTLVLYSSQYGTTKQYAEWIAEELSADLFEVAKIPNLEEYDTIIFGAPVYGGAIKNIAVVSNNMQILQNKRLFIFTVGITPPTAEETFANLLAKNYSPLMMQVARTFHFQGKIESKKLSLHHKLLLKMINSSMSQKIDINQNHVSREAITPLVAAVRGESHE